MWSNKCCPKMALMWVSIDPISYPLSQNIWKVPKFTNFARDTSESKVEHFTRYQTEAGDIANNENLKMKYFCFIWFTTVHTNLESI